MVHLFGRIVPISFSFSFLITMLVLFSEQLHAQVPLIQTGSLWKFQDNGTFPGTNWKDLSYNDLTWNAGQAQLGYGDGDESTVVDDGGFLKHITTYFRQSFTVIDPTIFSYLQLELLRDDGAVVYLNGTEVFRSNMPSGSIANGTLATSAIAGSDESIFHVATVSASLLVSSVNVLSVEIHQDNVFSSDISMDAKLTGFTTSLASNVVRGSYLQILSTDRVTIRWRTDVATDSEVRFGLSAGNLNYSSINPTVTNDHEVTITGLNPSTSYYYSIGSFNNILTQSSNHYFVTSPLVGSNVPTRFWVIGDAGTNTNDQRMVRDAFYNYNGGSHVDGWIMLGDNAYENGLDGEYQNAVFSNMYEATLENTALWPTIGNHDYANNFIAPSKSVDYYSIFSLPKNGESGGLASGSESYYSYNYANIHFIVLDSYGEDRDSTGDMVAWLKQDLLLNTQDWIVAYWHHPPYTKGSHDSDNLLLYDYELPQIRRQIIPVLERFGVDLVLCGHSHSYERSFLLDGHYGNSSSLDNSMLLDNLSGSYPSSCPYTKDTQVSKSNKGTVYAVVGCSGKTGTTSIGWPHPAMYKSNNTLLGSLSLEINDNRLDGKFITSSGTIEDQFTIMKNTSLSNMLSVCQGDSVYIQASWLGQYNWSVNNQNTQGIWFHPSNSQSVFVTDSLGCLADTFNISIIPTGTGPCLTTNTFNSPNEASSFAVYPNPGSGIFTLFIQSDKLEKKQPVHVFDYTGKLVFETAFTSEKNTNNYPIDLSSLSKGLYIITVHSNGVVYKEKLMIH